MKNKIILPGVLIALMAISFVSAFGVSSPYWEDHPMEAYPGQETMISLNLQNYAGAQEDIVGKVTIVEGSEIASVKEGSYTVSANSDLDIPVTVRIPSDAQVGTRYRVNIDVKTGSASGSGVGIGTGMSTKFDVVVVEKSPEKASTATSKINPYYIYITLLLIILVVVAIIYVRRKKVSRFSR